MDPPLLSRDDEVEWIRAAAATSVRGSVSCSSEIDKGEDYVAFSSGSDRGTTCDTDSRWYRGGRSVDRLGYGR
jgi:hypothetical protein